MAWLAFKKSIEPWGAHDLLHVWIGFAILVGAGLLLRRPLSSWLPWLCVLALELLNEALDLTFEKEAYIHEWQIVGSVKDIVNTMLLPTAILLLVRFCPSLFRPEHPDVEK